MAETFGSQRFRELVGRDVRVVSTIDHPYPSPPIHLFDGHLRLNQRFGESVLVVNWDVSHPLDRFYRYDLITDCGFIGKNPSFYHYKLHEAYAEQIFNPEPWNLMPRSIATAAQVVQRKHRLSDSFVADLVTRALELTSRVQEIYYSGIPPWRYTADHLILCYERLQQPRLRNLIAAQYCNYWLSLFTEQWIPWCLRTAKGALKFSNLQAAGLFKRMPFRPRTAQGKDIVAAENLGDIAKAVESGLLIPSLDVFYWSLAVADLQHYGNDFDFFSRLAAVTGISELSSLQCTGDEEDCRRFLKFDADYAVLLDIDGDEVRPSHRAYHQSKLTRVTTFGSVMTTLGGAAVEVLDDYANHKYENATLSLGRDCCFLNKQVG